MNKVVKLYSAIVIIGTVVGCQSIASDSGYGIIDYGDRNASLLKHKVSTLLNGHNEVIKITQFGHGNTAIDNFTGPFRDLVQQKFGDAGIGWITSNELKGQSYRSVKWRYYQSHIVRNSLDNLANADQSENVSIQISTSPKSKSPQEWEVRLMVRNDMTDSVALSNKNGTIQASYQLLDKQLKQWTVEQAFSTMPLTIQAKNEADIGGLWLQKAAKSGAIVSAIDLQKIQQSTLAHWPSEWLAELKMTESDLVILEYGAAEVFNEQLDATEYRKSLKDSIKKIRQQLPQAVILLISPPDLMDQTKLNGRCYERMPKSYEKVKVTQLAVARSERVLYWDWQKAMGGDCNIFHWYNEGLAEKDLVHLSPLGYEVSAEILYRSLMEYLGVPRK